MFADVIGQYLSHFRITGKLGEGAMGAVYRAEDTKLGRQVAIKVLPIEFADDSELLARFESEAKILASMNHPYIVTIYNLSSAVPTSSASDPVLDQEGDSRLHFLVMELVEGKTLDTVIPKGGMPLDRFFELAIPLAGALAAAHEHGVIHRDLKPGNIMVAPPEMLKVLDFGLAKRHTSDVELDKEMRPETMAQLTQKHQFIGTVPYMSPEQIRSEVVDQRSDLFSLGVILFEMVADVRPFQGDTPVDLISSILKDPPLDLCELRPELSGRLVDLIQRCLAKDCEARIQTALEISEQLIAIERTNRGDYDSAVGELLWPETEQSQTPDPRAVAILPFVNLSGTDEAEFLATGLHNDLITELSKVAGLTVISRTSVMGYREPNKPLPQVGRELGVGTIIEGAVQSDGSRVRLTAQLIDAITDVHRWADSYDRELSPETLFDIQSELTRRIVDSLLFELAADQQIPVGKSQTKDLEAYRLHALGRMQFDRRTEEGFQRAIEHFEKALERDPNYVLAWVGLADALALMEDYGYGDSEVLLNRAKEAVDRALKLDPDSAGAHASLGLYLSTIQDGPKAMRELELAVQIQPSYAEAHNWMGWVQNLIGQPTGALVSAQRAVELNPLSAEAVSNLSLSFLTNGKLENAVAEAHRSEELSPSWTTALFFEGIALYALGRYNEAKSLLGDITVKWTGLGAEATLALVHLACGDENAARQVQARIDPMVDPFARGLVHLALAEVDTAFNLFTNVAQLSAWPSLAVHHFYSAVWDTVRHDSRYHKLARQAYASWNLDSPGGK